MKIEKIQSELLKAAMKNHRHPFRHAVTLDEENKCVYVIDENGSMCMKISSHMFMLDIEKLNEMRHGINIKSAQAFFKNIDDSVPASLSGEIRALKSGECAKVVSADGEKFTWVNKKFLKYFENDCTFAVRGATAPVFVLEHGECVGLIMPVRVNK